MTPSRPNNIVRSLISDGPDGCKISVSVFGLHQTAAHRGSHARIQPQFSPFFLSSRCSLFEKVTSCRFLSAGPASTVHPNYLITQDKIKFKKRNSFLNTEEMSSETGIETTGACAAEENTQIHFISITMHMCRSDVAVISLLRLHCFSSCSLSINTTCYCQQAFSIWSRPLP